MAKRSKTKSKAGAAVKVILLILLVIIVLAAVFAGVYYGTNGFGGAYATFAANVNGANVIESRAVELPSGSKIKVTSFSDYSIKVEAAEPEEGADFALTCAGGEYIYSGYAGEDMTAGFTLTEAADGITITYGRLEEILSAVMGDEVTLQGEPSGELFKLVITSGKSTLELPFELSYGISFDTLGWGSMSMLSIDCPETAAAGDAVSFTLSLSADEGEGYVISRVVLTSYDTGEDIGAGLEADGSGYAFTMPAEEVVIMCYIIPEDM